MLKIKAENARNSRAIAEFSNAELGYFGLKLAVHVLIRGSLGMTEESDVLHRSLAVKHKDTAYGYLAGKKIKGSNQYH